MNGVIGMTSILMETKLTSEQRDFVNTIRTSGEALLTIINDILDFSKIESGKMELEAGAVRAGALHRGGARLFAPQAAAKAFESLQTWIRRPGRGSWGDVRGLKGRSSSNLVNHAIKFTPTGKASRHGAQIPLDPRRSGRWPRADEAWRSPVQDTGIGIPRTGSTASSRRSARGTPRRPANTTARPRASDLPSASAS